MENINYKSEIFKENLYELINNSNLPVCIVYYVVTLLQKQLQLHYYASFNTESPEKDIVINQQEESKEKEEEK